ncbi:MAG: hypothetical protein M3176_07615 [Chloroflexota bacterium]|nr:hypothetical protein [Chloroflexota bacterium]
MQVIIVEFAAEGHNDALMILCVLATLLLTVCVWPALAVATLLLGVLAKYVPLTCSPHRWPISGPSSANGGSGRAWSFFC